MDRDKAISLAGKTSAGEECLQGEYTSVDLAGCLFDPVELSVCAAGAMGFVMIVERE